MENDIKTLNLMGKVIQIWAENLEIPINNYPYPKIVAKITGARADTQLSYLTLVIDISYNVPSIYGNTQDGFLTRLVRTSVNNYLNKWCFPLIGFTAGNPYGLRYNFIPHKGNYDDRNDERKNILEQHNYLGRFKDLFKIKKNEGFKIESITHKDIKAILRICIAIFNNVAPPEIILEALSTVNWSISKKAVLNGKIIGCYLLQESNVNIFKDYQLEDLSKYNNLKGIEGAALAMLPQYRGMGYGKQLRDVPLNMDYDYIWGQHLKGLHNINDWIKFGRRVVAETENLYVTLMDLKADNFEKYHTYQKYGHTCGPACVGMVSKFLGIKNKSEDGLIDLCQCNTTTGTIDTGIKNALDNLGIRNKQNPFLGNEEKSMLLLEDTLKEGNVFIMRTLTKGIKHWIIVYGKTSESYSIADPWQGIIKYTKEELISIWKPRNFDGFCVYK